MGLQMELEVARKIQQILLPQQIPSIAGVDINEDGIDEIAQEWRRRNHFVGRYHWTSRAALVSL